MKIGILTFYNCDNYGAILQAYSLSTYIQGCGHEVKFIRHDLKKGSSTVTNVPSVFGVLKRAISNALTRSQRISRHGAFAGFVNAYFHDEEYNESFEKVIIGSDQVWNLNLTHNDFFYFGKEFNCEVSSYAASCGNYQSLSSSQKISIIGQIQQMKYVSVREEGTAKMLQNLTDKKVAVVLDPTLLVHNSVFRSIETPLRLSGRYVLIYDCMDKDVFLFVKNIAKQLGAKIVALSCCVRTRTYCKSYQSATVGEFLWLFSHAECIVTTSFHGCAISLSYRKNFYAMNFDEETTSRMKELLQSVGLLNRYVSPLQSDMIWEEIDYAPVEYRLSVLREDSARYINAILSE